MIVEAVLSLLATIIDGVMSVLPTDSLDLPVVGEDIAAWFGERAGPLNAILPIYEVAQFMVIVTTVWLPAVLVYTTVKWIYKHLPMIGKG
jgi:hypothetical protein